MAVPDAVPPSWELFNPGIHAGLIEFPIRMTLTSEGIRMIRNGEEVTDYWISQGLELGKFGEVLRRARDARVESPSRAALYRYFDADEVLLYVGITGDLMRRERSHVKRSSWMEFMARSTVERFSSREEAEAAEVAAIGSELPLFNARHNGTPDARQRLVKYLIKHGRVDLLSPAVSRG
ncbi:hypothetical protein DFJ69_5892 [Thermomonospora umbrina]|uniref:GIY-YIG domain-containing protein n=1 Tax=Thermomonospora umbrina TaxID=111806 RepID=A0A3D9SWN1_9ACTN|nr:hypothetical protein DFJ69_5892 [Thermomonospora umbrina]